MDPDGRHARTGAPPGTDGAEHEAAEGCGADHASRRAAGIEPDYRYTLANERTFLAWFRTALALIAGGVAVVQLIPPLSFPGARRALGIALTLAGGGLALAAAVRWRGVQAAMRRGTGLPPTRIPAVLAIGLAVLTTFLVVLLLLAERSR